MSGKLELRLLGNPLVTLDGEAVSAFRSRKTQALLLYLAVTKRPQTRLALAALLWGDLPEKQARRTLTASLSNLRDLVADHLQIAQHEVAFNPGSSYWCDVEQLQAGVKPASSQLEISSLQAVVELYFGDFLEGFYVDDAPEFEQWVLKTRTQLHDSVITLLQRLADHFEGEDAWEDAIQATRKLLHLEPWHEAAHRQLMRLLAQSGQRNAALAHYELCRQTLAEELDVDPEAATVALFEQIKAGSFAEKRSAPPTASVNSSPPRHSLPTPATAFVGREPELAEVARLLDDPTIRLLTILAPGGMGKTRLAIEAATRQIGHYRHGIFFVSPALMGDVEGLWTLIAGAVDFQFQPDKRSPKEQLIDYLRSKELLLLLDSFEHLLAAREALHELLQSAPHLRLLVTSRERLKLSGETIFRLGGMELPQAGTGNLAESSAVRLFLQAAQRLHPGFRLAGEDWRAVVELCRLVHGMPLAILLAAAWIDTLSPPEIAFEIRRSIDFLSADLHDLPKDQRSISAVLTQTWERMAESERAALSFLSVFRGGFTRHAAQAVSGASLTILGALTDKALLWRDANGRYGIHELLGNFAQERLMSANVATAASDAHCAYYVNLLESYAPKMKSRWQSSALEELEVEGVNLRVAWRWAVDHVYVDRLTQAVDVLCPFYAQRGHYDEGVAACIAATAMLEGLVEKTNAGLHLLAKVLIWQSIFSRRRGNYETARHLCHQSLAYLDRLSAAGMDVRSERAHALLNLGDMMWYMETSSAHNHLIESLSLCREIGDEWTTAAILRELARVNFVAGNYRQAREYALESLALRRRSNDQMGLAATLSMLTYIATTQGYEDEAMAYVREHYAIGQERGPVVFAQSLFILGLSQTFQGQFAAALPYYEQSMVMAEEMGDRHHCNTVTIAKAEAKMHLGSHVEALALCERALTVAGELGLRPHRADALCHVTALRIAQGAFEEAQEPLQECATLYQSVRQFSKLSRVYIFTGTIAYYCGDFASARRSLVDLLQMATQSHDFRAAMGALTLAALLESDAEAVKQRHDQALTCALELYTVAMRYPYIANSQWNAQVVGRVMEERLAPLDPQLASAARQRALARTLEESLALSAAV